MAGEIGVYLCSLHVLELVRLLVPSGVVLDSCPID
jgi:hypothetical protein